MADFDPVSYMMGQKAGPRGGSSTLSGLTDVDISNPTDGQTLVYNANSGKWENGAAGGGGGVLVVRGEEVGDDFILDHTYAEIVAAAPAVAFVDTDNSTYIKWLNAYGPVGTEPTRYAVAFGNNGETYVADAENGYPVFTNTN